MSLRLLISSIALMALTACGGGTGAPSFAELAAEAADLSGRLGGVADTTTLPATAGDVVFEGIIVLADDFGTSATGYTGDVAVVVDFAASTLTGSAGGFYESPITAGGTPIGAGTSVAGSLTFTDTLMIAGDDGVTPTITAGTLEIAGTVETISGSLIGEFGTETVNADFLVLADDGGLAVGGGPIADLDAALIAAR